MNSHSFARLIRDLLSQHFDADEDLVLDFHITPNIITVKCAHGNFIVQVVEVVED